MREAACTYECIDEHLEQITGSGSGPAAYFCTQFMQLDYMLKLHI